ncbi:MAG: esterase-like activity of phytase family protein, partial [Planctomycetota bacterium]|nr:esterase-like activity of phytase family protein [Planctomycetota bacterium]
FIRADFVVGITRNPVQVTSQQANVHQWSWEACRPIIADYPIWRNRPVELLALDAENFLAVERSFSTGVGNRIRIYNVNISGATDVSGLNALTGSETPVSKSLLFDLDVLGITLDNIEGITLGPKLANGNRSVILVSDNNFSGTQFTQFIVLQAVPEPSSMALCGVAVAALVFCGSRRRRTIG